MALVIYPCRLIAGPPGLDPAAARRGRPGLLIGGEGLPPARLARVLRGLVIGAESRPRALARWLRGAVAPAAAVPGGGVLRLYGRVMPGRPWPGAASVRGVVRVPRLMLCDVGPARKILTVFISPDAVPYRARRVGLSAGSAGGVGRWRGKVGRRCAALAPVLFVRQWLAPVGLSDGLALPNAWAAYPLPAGAWIGYELAALALARGEVLSMDGEGGAWIAGRRVLRKEGEQRVFNSADMASRWRARMVSELAGVLVGRLCSPGAYLADWQTHGRERDRRAARRLLALAEKQADPGKRDAWREDAAWLIARI